MGSLRHSKRIRSASTKQRASACWPSAKVRISCETKLARARERPWVFRFAESLSPLCGESLSLGKLRAYKFREG